MTCLNSSRRGHTLTARVAALCLFAAALLFPGIAHAQWTTPDPNNNISNTNTGNVGVGTSNPVNGKLEITSDTGVTAGEHSLLYASKAGTSSGGFRLGYRADGSSVTGGYIRSLSNLSFFLGTTGSPLAMTITNTGNVGFGTVNPQSPFHLWGSNATAYSSTSVPTFGQRITNADTTNNNALALRFSTLDTAGVEQTAAAITTIFTNHASSGVSGDLVFQIKNAGAVKEALRVNSAGNVGIGNTNPSSQLFVGSGTAAVQALPGLNVALGGNSYVSASNGTINTFFGSDTSTYGIVGTLSNHPLGLRANNTLAMTVMPAGNVGIGTTNPAHKLDVAGNANASGLCIAGDCKTAWSQVGGGTSSQWTTNGSNIHFNTGNVGVGTTTPSYPLEVSKSQAASTLFQVTNANSSPGNAAGVRMFTSGNNALTLSAQENAGAGGYAAINQEANLPLLIKTSNTERMRITGAGNVGIGTSAPTQKLHVFGGNVSHQWSSTVGQEYGFYTSIQNNHLTSNLYFDGQWKMMTAGKGAFISTAPLGGMAFSVYADNTSRAANAGASFNSLMQVTMDGNVGVGTSTPAHKLDVTGNANASGLCIAGDCKTAWSQVGGSSQWANGSGSSINYGTGNVGVGTTTPAAKLHVVGGSRHEGTGRVYLGAIAAQGARGLELVEENATTFSIRHHDPSVAWRNIAINPYGGNVGVGTVNPRGAFEVAGGSLFLGDMGNPAWGDVVMRGRVISASSNLHISPPGGSAVYIDSNYREAGGAAGPVNLNVSGDVIAGGNISAKYQDVAEWVPSTQKLAPGTVVVLDRERNNHVLASTSAYDTGVAGVISEQPGVILGQGGADKLMVATTGRVRIKVDATNAPILIGDLLVTSDVAGVAMKSEPVAFGSRKMHAPGTIIGKALEPLEKGKGEILVLLSLQ